MTKLLRAGNIVDIVVYTVIVVAISLAWIQYAVWILSLHNGLHSTGITSKIYDLCKELKTVVAKSAPFYLLFLSIYIALALALARTRLRIPSIVAIASTIIVIVAAWISSMNAGTSIPSLEKAAVISLAMIPSTVTAISLMTLDIYTHRKTALGHDHEPITV